MSTTSQLQKQALDMQAVSNFREYLQIPTVHPNINFDAAVNFLKKQATSLNLPVKIYHITPSNPIVILTWIGTEPLLPSVLLNSHMDVVPVFEDKWSHKPFSAHLDEHNRIYARGAQDMKSVGIQYLEAIRRLKFENVALKRTVHISFMPGNIVNTEVKMFGNLLFLDEELGGENGMRRFVHTRDFQNLNVGVALDEGMTSPADEFFLFYAERTIWHIHFHCSGNPGHGSLLLENTAGEKVASLLAKFYSFREEEQRKLKNDPNLTIGDVTTINLTQMKGGVQTNVIPPELTIAIDCRIPPKTDIKKWEETINQWCNEAGSGIRIEYEQKQPHVPATNLDSSNPYWTAFKDAIDKLGLKLKTQVFPAGTDSAYVRGVGIPALGFSPINNTPVLLHGHDEYLGVDTFLKGIEIYCKIVTAVANVEPLG